MLLNVLKNIVFDNDLLTVQPNQKKRKFKRIGSIKNLPTIHLIANYYLNQDKNNLIDTDVFHSLMKN